MGAPLKPKLLIADDEYGIREFFYELFRDHYDVHLSEDGMEAIDLLQKRNFDVALLDMKMPKKNGMDVLNFIQENEISTVPIIVSAVKDLAQAVEAMKRGAFDYISKPPDTQKLSILLRNAVEQKRLREKINSLEEEIQGKFSFPNLIGNSKAMRTVVERIRQVLDNDATVLIYGKSGTGKEVVARTIHYNGQRKSEPFIAVDCASIPQSLIETELFGFEKGAFTGASKTTIGKFEAAQGGTLFLDEISNISMDAQAKLLRVLQEREIMRVGGSKKIKVDVRLISASNRNLKEMIAAGEFREDLYYRLNVIPIDIPDLKERGDDIPLLVFHFLKIFNEKYSRSTSVSHAAMDALSSYGWPGNIRELENLMNRLVLTSSGEIQKKDLPAELTRPKIFSDSENPLESDMTLSDLESIFIKKILKRHDGNLSESARVLGITRKTLYTKIEKYELDSK